MTSPGWGCAFCRWEHLTTTWDDGTQALWARLVLPCSEHQEAPVATLEAVLDVPRPESSLLTGDPPNGVVVLDAPQP